MASERALHATTWDAGPEGAEARDAGPQVAAPRIVLVHGFTQTGASWSLIAPELATDSEVVAPDLPGHGRSPAPDAGSGLAETAALVGQAGGRATYIGYSLGGRCCLQLALQAPQLVERLVLIGAHPGIENETDRQLRREDDEALATQLEQGGDAAIPEFVESWLSGPLFSHLSEEQADRPSRLTNSAAGLAASLRTVGTGAQAPLWGRLGELDMPVLVMAGALDPKFAALAERTAAAIGPGARLELVAGAGHAVAFERPDAFVALVREFLAGAGERHPD